MISQVKVNKPPLIPSGLLNYHHKNIAVLSKYKKECDRDIN